MTALWRRPRTLRFGFLFLIFYLSDSLLLLCLLPELLAPWDKGGRHQGVSELSVCVCVCVRTISCDKEEADTMLCVPYHYYRFTQCVIEAVAGENFIETKSRTRDVSRARVCVCASVKLYVFAHVYACALKAKESYNRGKRDLHTRTTPCVRGSANPSSFQVHTFSHRTKLTKPKP